MSIVPEKILFFSQKQEMWRPAATAEIVHARARLFQAIRKFMYDREILEVETPILVHHGVTDVNLDNLSTTVERPDSPASEKLYLITSPEYAMKRMLAAGCGPIYQITRAFRNNEYGALHNPEFSILEWYRPGFDQSDMMDEIIEFLECLGFSETKKTSYALCFQEYTGLDPHLADKSQLLNCARSCGLEDKGANDSVLQDFIFSHLVTPHLGNQLPELVYDYPECQSALARLSLSSPPVARRFELFINGIEIANGFEELTDVEEQQKRFTQDNNLRRKTGKKCIDIDNFFMSALDSGLPDCAGVAFGLDRLLMVLQKLGNIHEVITFPHDRA